MVPISAVDKIKNQAIAAAWVKSLENTIGIRPDVVIDENGFVAIEYTPEQKKKIENWADKKMMQSVFPKDQQTGPAPLDLGVNEAFGPVVIKYAAIAGVASFLIGRMSKR